MNKLFLCFTLIFLSACQDNVNPVLDHQTIGEEGKNKKEAIEKAEELKKAFENSYVPIPGIVRQK